VTSQADKRQRLLEKALDEKDAKLADLQTEIKNLEEDCRGLLVDVNRLKGVVDETQDGTEFVKKDIKKLSGSFLFLNTSIRGKSITNVRNFSKC